METLKVVQIIKDNTSRMLRILNDARDTKCRYGELDTIEALLTFQKLMENQLDKTTGDTTAIVKR